MMLFSKRLNLHPRDAAVDGRECIILQEALARCKGPMIGVKVSLHEVSNCLSLGAGTSHNHLYFSIINQPFNC